jgi:hypothetical protein
VVGSPMSCVIADCPTYYTTLWQFNDQINYLEIEPADKSRNENPKVLIKNMGCTNKIKPD